jgi:2-iminoacetate synthase ThiH
MFINEHVSTSELMMVAAECRQKQVPGNKVGWIIDRNINITNVCVSGCLFCNFHCKINEEVQYITTIDEYCEKTDELYDLEAHKIRTLEKICANEGMEPVIFNLSEYMKSGALLSCMVMHLNRVDMNKQLI